MDAGPLGQDDAASLAGPRLTHARSHLFILPGSGEDGPTHPSRTVHHVGSQVGVVRRD
jgi:hypothetical protein